MGTSGIRGILEYRPDLGAIRRGDDSSLFITGLKEKTYKWIEKATVQKHNIKDIFLYGTDIAENYPVLVGIKKGSVQPTHGSKFINLHEKRTEKPIQMSETSHIEVPKDRIQDTALVLQKAGYENIPILPIEYGEEYCRNFSFRKLVGGKPLTR